MQRRQNKFHFSYLRFSDWHTPLLPPHIIFPPSHLQMEKRGKSDVLKKCPFFSLSILFFFRAKIHGSFFFLPPNKGIFMRERKKPTDVAVPPPPRYFYGKKEEEASSKKPHLGICCWRRVEKNSSPLPLRSLQRSY